MRIQRKIILGLAAAVMITTLNFGSAFAAAWCHSGMVTKIGIFPDLENTARSKYAVTVSCTAANGDWDGELRFFLIPGLGDAAYATALTAINSNQPVEVRVYRADPNALMERINLLPAQ